MEKAKVDRINELGRLAKQRELTEEEKRERQLLREEYLAEVRRQLKGDMKNGTK
jgi:uncharacterized protein YnzC (UPF0291/DUF896 family)